MLSLLFAAVTPRPCAVHTEESFDRSLPDELSSYFEKTPPPRDRSSFLCPRALLSLYD